MSTVTLCVYCEQLPTQSSSGATRVMRCPLCHAEIGSTASGGKFRVLGNETSTRQRFSRRVALWNVVAAACLLAGGIALEMLLRDPAPTPQPAFAMPAPAVSIPEIASVPSPSAAPAHETPNPNVAVKPFGPSWRNRIVAKASPYPRKETAMLPDADAVAAIGEGRLYPGKGPKYDQALWDLLNRTPEIALHEPFSKKIAKSEARTLIAKSLKDALDINQKANDPDAAIRKLIATRTDLEGLPFLLGKACRLEPKASAQLSVAAVMVRGPRSAGSARMTSASQEPYPFAEFWRQWADASSVRQFATRMRDRGSNRAEWALDAAHAQAGIGAISQILSGEDQQVRRGLVLSLTAQGNSLAAKTIAKFAVFDPDHEVRELALTSLRHRRAEEYAGQLVAAVRYPWAPASRHAAEAIVRLDVKEAIPSLIDFLDEPNPAGPFVVEKEGNKSFAVRELVRVNHHRNCQLCHAPADRNSDPDQVLASVPSPADPLPPSLSTRYYGLERTPDLAVRADTTYLRQDFSALLKVEGASPWPDMQRFDFMIRKRILGKEEAATRLAQAEPKCSSPQHDAALAALQHLTGYDLGPSADAWRRVQREGAFSRGVSKPGSGR